MLQGTCVKRAVRRGGSRGALEPPFLRHKINIVPRIDFYTCQLTSFTFDGLKTTFLTSVKAEVKASLVKRRVRGTAKCHTYSIVIML